MPKSAFSPAYGRVIQRLVALRKAKGLSQVELARRLAKTQQYISYIERCERRLDVVEFYAVARAIGVDPVALFAELAAGFPERVEV